MSDEIRRGDELFDKLSKQKKQRRRKVILTVAAVIALAAVVLTGVVLTLRRNVEARFAAAEADVQEYAVQTGTIHTVVAGSGILTEEDLEDITTPKGVEVTEVFVEAGDAVEQGQVLASVDMATVMTALSSLQEELESLDDDIQDAKGEEVSSTITAGVTGRVKTIYAEKGQDVSVCMAQHGALAVLSLDGYLAVDLDAEAEEGEQVLVTSLASGTAWEGEVKRSGNAKKVLVTDNGPLVGDEVSISKGELVLGTGKLYIHQSLAVTGYAGTIKNIYTKENAKVSKGSSLFQLENTAFSANYDSLLRDREEMEETLMELLTIYRDGAVLAPMDGSVSSVSYDEDTHAASYSLAESLILTMYPDLSMTIAISVDETDILSLEEGQKAQITVSSVGEEVFPGEVTQISKVADTSTGVTRYSAEVTLEKTSGMLPGMSADVDIQIQGVENALIIPIEALHQTRDMYFVYTAYDSETKQYGGMREVTVGMQNDTQAEILSGLKEGEVIYYTEAAQNIFEIFMGSGMSGGMSGMSGGMPSGMGGGMPSGNMGGQRPGGDMGGMPGGNRGG